MDWDAFLEEDVFDAFFEWIVPLVSLLLLGVLTILLRWQVEDPLLSVLNLLLPALFVTLIVYQGLVLHDSALPSGERRTVATWYAVGIYTMVGLGAWTFLLSMLGGEPVPRSVEAVTEIVAGGMFGFLVGIAQLRAEQNAEAATQAELEQEFLERQQDTNEVLNRILRHHLLNGLTVIRGQAQILEDHVDGEGDQQVETIIEQSTEMADTIEDIRRITRTLTEDPDLVPVDLDPVLESQLERVRDHYPEASVRRNGHVEDITVEANDLLSRAIGNVLNNALDHNTAEEPTVEVSVDERGEQVVVSVTDNGPGVPDDRKDDILEASVRGVDSEGEGLGLFLTASILEQYGGEVDIRDSDSTGTTVDIALPMA